MINEHDIKSLFSSIDLNQEEQVYLDSQATRPAYITNLVKESCNHHTVRKLLYKGPHFLSRCITELIRPEVSVSTLGYEYPKSAPSNIIDEYVQCFVPHLDSNGRINCDKTLSMQTDFGKDSAELNFTT